MRDATAAPSDHEAGFTMIEVMVVVLIIGILMAIGIPTYLGARNRAFDRSAQTQLRVAENTAMAIYTDAATFADATTAALGEAEPSLSWLGSGTASTDAREVSVARAGDGTQFGAASMSDSGTCFYLRARENGQTLYGQSSSSPCTGSYALTVFGTSW
ncbi:MAG: prepilin-type N-terminal cleavage/methylation domain-containing protein [Actinomycetota bacterium]|nr:prepilin-type N-terminal cleavage/methylation domain-containing protein [Actinomycetota bacterium]